MKVPPNHALFRRDDTVVPKECYTICNDAYLEAASSGKTPSLCGSNSSFRVFYEDCKSCISTNAPDPDVVTKSYLDPLLGQFIEYCSETSPSPRIVTNMPTGSATSSKSSSSTKRSTTKTTTGASGYYTIPTNYFTLSVETTSLVATFPDGLVTKVPATRTWTVPNLSLWNITAPPPTEPVTGIPTPTSALNDPPAEDSSSSQAWIAGPVIGGVVAISILAFAALFFLRIRPRRKAVAVGKQQGGETPDGRGNGGWEAAGVEEEPKDPLQKAQLHSDSIPSSAAQEMEATGAAGRGEKDPLEMAELPSDSIPMPQEMDGGGGIHPGMPTNIDTGMVELSAESGRVEHGRAL